jgi:phosphohistidine phosphatase SixA
VAARRSTIQPVAAMLRSLCLIAALLFAPLAALANPPPKLEGEALVAALKQPGHVAFMRHAWAPFEGAPKPAPHAAEDLGPCETQRNLDDFGRQDATRVGAAFAAAGIRFDRVWTSHVCRCRETAERIVGGPVANLPLINSYFADPDKSRGPAQLVHLKAFLNWTLAPTMTVLMVTHGSLISDLTGFDTQETEIVIVRADGRGGIEVIGYGTI